jgi:hypothetical protein
MLLRRRGHAKPSRRGDDPEADALERRLLVTATRGVVRLFNAVSAPQTPRRHLLSLPSSPLISQRTCAAAYVASFWLPPWPELAPWRGIRCACSLPPPLYPPERLVGLAVKWHVCSCCAGLASLLPASAMRASRSPS